MKALADFNQTDFNEHQISMKAGVAYPTVCKYMRGDALVPTIAVTARILRVINGDWKAALVSIAADEIDLSKQEQ